jgi:hypothetical protein
MDEQEIRKWAWEFLYNVTSATCTNKNLPPTITVEACFKHADDLAAWIMSGKLPERL